MGDEGQGTPAHKWIGLIAGPVLFLAALFLPTPAGMTPEGQRVAAVALLMGVWWITEAIPIPATSLMPLALFPLLGILDGRDLASSYGDSNIFLFAGGFFIASAMQKWDLHERIALNIISVTGTNPRLLILGFMIATAFLSLWISNAATTMMMVPIGVAVITQIERRQPDDGPLSNFGVAVMLGIAYASSIGGTGTLVGTPPNIVLTGMMKNLYPEAPPISFAQWMMFGLPFAVVFIPIVWFVLTRLVFTMDVSNDGAAGRAAVRERLAQLGQISRGERIVLIVFVLTALAWIFRADLELGVFTIPGWSRLIPHPDFANDGTVAILFALILFLLPVHLAKGEFALDWEWARRIPWGVLLLFGGGFALAKGFSDTGLVKWAGGQLAFLEGMPPIVVVLTIAAAVTFLTEFTSNTALTTIMLPILAVTATDVLSVHPLLLMVPATLSASMAFMLPVATPPNALVFGSGYVTIQQMARAGFVLNLIGIVLVTAITYFVVIPILGLSGGAVPAWAR